MEDEKLFNVLDWGKIEEIVYSESDRPHDILGKHKIDEGWLVQAFFPDALEVSVCYGNKKMETMTEADDKGFFACLLDEDPGKYNFLVIYKDAVLKSVDDPYSFAPTITGEELESFEKGIFYDSYKKLGAHYCKIDNIEGVSFAVWAPNALRVSVVGEFNFWNGNLHQMRRLGNSGIFEIFIPGVNKGVIYKYEIKVPGGDVFLKSDPYANFAEVRPRNASVVADLDYKWGDDSWVKERNKTNYEKEPVFIYELNLGSWMKPEENDSGKEFYNYREIAEKLTKYVLDMGYTHVEIMPVMEHPYDGSWGYQVTGYFAPTSRYGTPQDFMYFVDYLHKHNIGVILDWVPAHFPKDSFGLARFDGTCLYEHLDPRQGEHPHWGTLIFNYGRPQVTNFLISSALFWAEQYHADGIRFDAVASMLYLDYGKNDGEWVANKYGGNENLEAIEFLKHLNSIFKKRNKGVALIAEESTAWPKVTGDLNDEGLGFDYKWNMGWMNDIIDYMKCDPIFRAGRHGELTFSLVYAYSEKYILPFSHDEVVHLKGSMITKMPGNELQKFANLRTLYGYMLGHPGKKLLFMGQDIGLKNEWIESNEIDWSVLNYDIHRGLQNFMKKLLEVYKENPALYKYDYKESGFKWINCEMADKNVVTFIRSAIRRDETLVFAVNFSGQSYTKERIGVPYRGQYIEILNSDSCEFGGKGEVNSKPVNTDNIKWDDYLQSIEIDLPALSTVVFRFKDKKSKKTTAKKTTKKTRKSTAKKTAEKKTTADKKTAEKKTTEKKTAEKKAEVKVVEKKETKPAVKKAEKTELKKVEKKETKPAVKKAEKTELKKVEKKETKPAVKKAEKTELKKVEKKETKPAVKKPEKTELKKTEKKETKPAVKLNNKDKDSKKK